MPVLSKFEYPSKPWPSEPVCYSLRDVVGWCKSGFRRLSDHNVVSTARQVSLVSGRTLRTSSAFSGVESPEIADDIVKATASSVTNEFGGKKFVGSSDAQLPQPLGFHLEWAIENNSHCIEELLHMPGGPNHLFGNILDVVQPRHREKFGLDGGEEQSPSELRKWLPFAQLRPRAWCLKHRQVCNIKRSASRGKCKVILCMGIGGTVHQTQAGQPRACVRVRR